MSLYSLSNNATTTLNGNINNSTTTVVVASASGFPSSGSFVILVDTELMLVTAGQGTTSWTVTRGLEGTTAASHTSGATVGNVISAGFLSNNYADLFSNQTIAGTKTFSTTPVGLVDTAGTQTVSGVKTLQHVPGLARFFGVSSGIDGTPALSVELLLQSGTDVVTLDALGQATINWPNAFPTGVLFVISQNGDPSAKPAMFPTSTSVGLTNFSIKCYTGTSPTPAGAARINWVAIGW